MANSERVATPLYAARLPAIPRRRGQLAVLLAVVTLAVLAALLVFAEYRTALRYPLAVTALIAAGVSLTSQGAPSSILANETPAITALAFVLGPLITTFPVMAAGPGFEDAMFERISGAPSGSRVLRRYQREKFMFSDDDTRFETGDEAVLITHGRNMEAPVERRGARAKART